MTQLSPQAPHYLLSRQQLDTTPPWGATQEVSVLDIFEKMFGFFRTLSRVSFFNTEDEVRQRFSEFLSLSEEELKKRYFPTYYHRYGGKSFGGISNLHEIKRQVLLSRSVEGHIHPILYAPFHYKYTYCDFTTGFGFVSYQYTAGTPPGMPYFNIVSGHSSNPLYTPVFAFSSLCRDKFTYRISVNGVRAWCNVPFYLYTNLLGTWHKTPNIKRAFLSLLKTRYGTVFTTEVIFGYIYALLWHKGYRTNYTKYYRPSYPSIPLVKSREKFHHLGTLGIELYTLHLKNPATTPASFS